ncbi:MAG: lysoplasmalogenase [Acidobacteria bacterium]|nr:lysoplasmalogenase [Acidobacteriota bacterium]
MLVLLIGAALATDPFDPTVKTMFVIALVLSLIGDVILMLDDAPFIAGLGSFLLAHIAYIVGMAQVDLSSLATLVALGAVAAPLAVVGPRLIRSVKANGIAALTIGVGVYAAVITTMVVVAGATTQWLVITAAVMFYASDTLLGWNRFVEPIPHGISRVALNVLPHLFRLAPDGSAHLVYFDVLDMAPLLGSVIYGHGLAADGGGAAADATTSQY